MISTTLLRKLITVGCCSGLKSTSILTWVSPTRKVNLIIINDIKIKNTNHHYPPSVPGTFSNTSYSILTHQYVLNLHSLNNYHLDSNPCGLHLHHYQNCNLIMGNHNLSYFLYCYPRHPPRITMISAVRITLMIANGDSQGVGISTGLTSISFSFPKHSNSIWHCQDFKLPLSHLQTPHILYHH